MLKTPRSVSPPSACDTCIGLLSAQVSFCLHHEWSRISDSLSFKIMLIFVCDTFCRVTGACWESHWRQTTPATPSPRSVWGTLIWSQGDLDLKSGRPWPRSCTKCFSSFFFSLLMFFFLNNNFGSSGYSVTKNLNVWLCDYLRLVFEGCHKNNQITAVELYTSTPIFSTHFQGHQREGEKRRSQSVLSWLWMLVSWALALLCVAMDQWLVLLTVLQPDVIKSFTSDPRIVALAEFFLGQADLVSDAATSVRICREEWSAWQLGSLCVWLQRVTFFLFFLTLLCFTLI